MEQAAKQACTSTCPCRIDLDAAVAGLNASSEILLDSILFGSDEIIEGRFATVRIAWAKVTGAHAAYLDHFAEA